MKQHLTICLTCGLLVFSSQGQESTPASSAADTAAPKAATAGAGSEAYGALLKSELELNAQFKLLSSLSQEHGQRAEQATKDRQGQKATWESELAAELGLRTEALLKQLNEATKQRLTFEQSNTNAGGLTAATISMRVTPPEAEFLAKLGERFDRVNQDLVVTRQYAYDYVERIRTNGVGYDLQKAVAEFEQNARKVRQLEQELSDLELRKLEFQALRRP